MTQILLLQDDGTTKCRKPLQSIVDQSTIKGNGEGTKFALDMGVVAAALDGDGTRASGGKIDADLVVDAPLSGAGRSDSPLKVAAATNTAAGVMPHTGAGNIPADMDRDGSDISPAAVKKMLGYIKPVGVSGNLDASQLSQDAIEVPMLSGVSCTGGTNGNPKFTIPMENGGKCDIDLGALKGYGGGGTVVWEGLTQGCISLAGKGAGMYVAYLRSPASDYRAKALYYAVPFFFFDVPDIFETGDVAIDAGVDSFGKQAYPPNMCTEITARLYTKTVSSYTGDGNATNPYIFAPNIVYQTFKSGMFVYDTTAGTMAPVYKIVKLT